MCSPSYPMNYLCPKAKDCLLALPFLYDVQIIFIYIGEDQVMFVNVATPLLVKCEDDTHTSEMGTWESFETPETLELDCRGQKTSPWGVIHVNGKLLKCRCWKWPRMSHLDICSTSYGKKKGRESNWQFDSQPLKVGNRPDPDVCRWSVTHCWKTLNKSYKFALDLIPIQGLKNEL